MKFYVATGLANHVAHNAVRDALVRLGHEITYDWTSHGPVWRRGRNVICQTSVAESSGVRDADFVIVLLPGGRGTHAELGIAIAYDKPILLVSPNPNMFAAHPDTCAFYHHPNVIPSRSDDPLEIAQQSDDVAQAVSPCRFIANDGESHCGIRKKQHDAMSKLHAFDGDRERQRRYAS